MVFSNTDMWDTCIICTKHVLHHSYQLQCDTCKRICHIKCLPCVTKEDSIYIDRLTNNWLCITCISLALPFIHLVEENDFMDALSESWMSYKYFTFESLLEK